MKRISDVMHRVEHDRRFQIVAVLLITSFGALLRFYRLGAWSLWIDEIFTINRANAHVNLQSLLAAWWHPSISLILARGAMELFGFSVWSARLASALIGIVSIPVIFLVVKRWISLPVALIAAMLLAVAPWHLEWSQNARYYTSQMLFYFLAAYFFYQAFEQDRLRYLLPAVFLLALAVAERFTAVLFVPVLFAYLVFLAVFPGQKPPGYNRRNLALVTLPAVGFGLFELVRYLVSGDSYLIGAIELVYSQPIDDPFRLALFIGYNIGLPLVSFGLLTAVHFLKERSRTGLFLLLNAVVPVILLLLVNPFYFTKDRYIFFVLPFWIVLAAMGVHALFVRVKENGRLLVLGILVLLIVDSLGANIMYYQINHGNRRNWNRAFEIIRERAGPGDRIVTWWEEFGPFYTDQEIISWADLDADTVTESQYRYWFILDEETIWGNTDMKAWLESNGELIDIIYQRRQDDTFLKVFLFDPAR